ncbi:MAG: hypothetical protein WD793_14655 [Steroidobacteraceae bacterium]
MRRSDFIAMCLISLPAAAAEPAAEPADAEFLEFLAELPDEDTGFMAYLESRSGERELKRAEKAAAKEDDDE